MRALVHLGTLVQEGDLQNPPPRCAFDWKNRKFLKLFSKIRAHVNSGSFKQGLERPEPNPYMRAWKKSKVLKLASTMRAYVRLVTFG